jgi:hypothetical protein
LTRSIVWGANCSRWRRIGSCRGDRTAEGLTPRESGGGSHYARY